ncbi:hypothetical protein GX441_03700 [bacterium]|nr:hypothetical protein [bacterium]
MKRFCVEKVTCLWVLGMLGCVISLFGQIHDLKCYEIIQPEGDFVLADSAIVPVLGIANLGSSPEENFYVYMQSVDIAEEDTVYAESVLVSHIGAYPDSIEVEFPACPPEGKCDPYDGDYVDGVKYELLGIPEAELDKDHSNDSCFEEVTSLLEHDVGVTDLDFNPPPPDGDCYEPGTEVVITGTVENFGFKSEEKIPLRLVFLDKTADPDTVVYESIQTVELIGSRSDTTTGDYYLDVIFPVWVVPSKNWFTITCATKLNNDECPDNNFESCSSDPCAGIENEQEIKTLELEAPLYSNGVYIINYSLPLSSWLRLDLYDASGRFVRNLYNDPCSAGTHTLTWDGKDSGGKRVSSGAYFVRLEAGENKLISKVVMIR